MFDDLSWRLGQRECNRTPLRRQRQFVFLWRMDGGLSSASVLSACPSLFGSLLYVFVLRSYNGFSRGGFVMFAVTEAANKGQFYIIDYFNSVLMIILIQFMHSSPWSNKNGSDWALKINYMYLPYHAYINTKLFSILYTHYILQMYTLNTN